MYSNKLYTEDFEELKNQQSDLYYQLAFIPDAFKKNSLAKTSTNKLNFLRDVKDFLEKLSVESKQVKYVEDYIWICETITYWESYLESSFNQLFQFEIFQPEELCSKYDNPIYSWTLNQISQKISLKKADLLLVNFLSNYQIKMFAELLETRRIFNQKIYNKNILAKSWNSYDEYTEAIIDLKINYQKYIQNDYNNVQPTVFLYDYAGVDAKITQRAKDNKNIPLITRPKLQEYIHDIFREIQEYFWQKNISVVYFIDKNTDFHDFQIISGGQLKKWQIINSDSSENQSVNTK